MKITFRICLTALLLIAIQQVEAEIFVEAKAAYFQPTNHKFKKIYSGGGIYGGEASAHLFDNIYAFASVDFYTKEGHSIGGNNSTKINILPIATGLKYFVPTCYADLYAGLGITGTWVDIKDKSPYVIQHIQKGGVGGIAKLGALVNITESFAIDLFTNYSYTKINFHDTHNRQVTRQNANLSGWSFGAGLVYRFGCY